MNARRVLAILTKDLRDAWRDGRVAVVLLLPIAFALFNTLASDGSPPTMGVAIVEPVGSGVARELRVASAQSVKLDLTSVRDSASARALVATAKADLAVVVGPAGAKVLMPEDASPAAQSVAGILPVALARAGGREPPPMPAVEIVPAGNGTAAVRPSFATLLSIVLFVAFVAMMVVPIQTAEELETGTFIALRLAASGREILAAKALAGCVYGAAGVALTAALTDLHVHDHLLFGAAACALIVTLVGFGLLLGLLARNTTAINTYAGFLVLPLIALTGTALVVDSGIVATVSNVLPSTQAAKLLADATVANAPFETGPASWIVIALWAAVGYAALARIASRREL